jgi:hypothetical protein
VRTLLEVLAVLQIIIVLALDDVSATLSYFLAIQLNLSTASLM